MAKVEGSNPFIRFQGKPCRSAGRERCVEFILELAGRCEELLERCENLAGGSERLEERIRRLEE
jgi:hypothetical protein